MKAPTANLVLAAGMLLWIFVADSLGQGIAITRAKQRDSGGSWQVRVTESVNENGREFASGVRGAFVEAWQDGKMKWREQSDANGYVNFPQLDYHSGDVSVRAKRSDAENWEETIGLVWRVPDAEVQLASARRGEVEWEPCSSYPVQGKIGGPTRVVACRPVIECRRVEYVPTVVCYQPVTIYEYCPPATTYTVSYCPPW